MAYGTVLADTLQTSTAGGVLGAGNASIMKNRIINGAMVINQRGFNGTPTDGQYTLDRFVARLSQASKFTVQQSTTAPAGFINSLQVTSSSAYSVASGDYFAIQQNIEGLNCTDLGWGTANAKTVTLSFQVYSSLTGTFGGALSNGSQNRSYPFTYTVSSANTWTTISVTIAGDTTGTWLTTNGIGVMVFFGLGMGSTYSGTAGAWAGSAYLSATGATSVVGTSGATFYITGVQLEVGSSATGFEYRQYGQELALCQRYCYAMNSANGANRFAFGFANSTTKAYCQTPMPVPMRTYPSLTTSGASSFQLSDATVGTTLTAISIQTVTSDINKTCFDLTTASGLTAFRPYYLEPTGASTSIILSAEL